MQKIWPDVGARGKFIVSKLGKSSSSGEHESVRKFMIICPLDLGISVVH